MYDEYEGKSLPNGKKHSELRLVIRVLLDEKKIERAIIVTAGDHIDADSTKIHTKLIEYLQNEIDDFMMNVDRVTTDKGPWYEHDTIMTV